mgnify:CR=1 FL=1
MFPLKRTLCSSVQRFARAKLWIKRFAGIVRSRVLRGNFHKSSNGRSRNNEMRVSGARSKHVLATWRPEVSSAKITSAITAWRTYGLAVFKSRFWRSRIIASNFRANALAAMYRELPCSRGKHLERLETLHSSRKFHPAWFSQLHRWITAARNARRRLVHP